MQNLEKKDTIPRIKKTKSEIKKELEDSVENVKKNKNRDIEQRKRMPQTLFKNLEKSSGIRKVTQYCQLTTKVKYFRSSSQKNNLLTI